MSAEQQKLLFYTTAKSIVASPEEYSTQEPDPSQVTVKVSPKGNNYHIRRDFQLDDDDWVIYGVASTSDVDLVDDVVDAEDVFSDSLEEFVNTGRIFWEHGYKLAGKVEADNPITAPIGVPYLVEVFNNELLVYIVLDKSHPTSQMVWQRVNQDDKRFAKGIGLSIGALPQGKPKMIKDPMTGNFVKKCPKMRLYEISVTGQPINPHTWTEVVKSFLAEELKEEEQMATKKATKKEPKVTKSVKDEKKVTKALDDETEDMGGVEMEPADAGMAADAAPDAAMGAAAGADVGAGMAEDPMAGAELGAAAGAEGAAAADPMAAGMEADPMGDMGGDPMMGADTSGDGMLDMLGTGEEETGLEDSVGGEDSDIGMDVIMDKVDMLASQMAQVLSIISSEADAADVGEAVDNSLAPDVEQTPAPDGEESDAGAPDAEAVSEPSDVIPDEDENDDEEEDAFDAISKSLAAQADRTDLILEVVKSIPALLKAVESLNTRLDQIEDGMGTSVPKKMNVSASSGGVDADRADYEAKTKSVGDDEGDKKEAVTKGVASNRKHPGYEDASVNDARSTDTGAQDDEAVIKSILGNDEQLSLLAELVSTFKSLNGNPIHISEKKTEIYSIAHEVLGLSRSAFRKAASMVKSVD